MRLFSVGFTLAATDHPDLRGSLTVYALDAEDAARVAWAELQRLVARWADAAVVVECVEPEGV